MLPAPALCRSGPLPARAGYAYEVKWDGFRALVSTEHGLEVRSRRRWNMTSLLPELAALPDGLVLDGELVAFGDDGLPSFPRLCERMLFRVARIPVMLMVFDVLRVDGKDAMCLPYCERRALLEALDLNGPSWFTPDSFDDGQALWEVVCAQGLEGVVAKRLDSRYRPAEKVWTKTENRDYWRYGSERKGALEHGRRRQRLTI